MSEPGREMRGKHVGQHGLGSAMDSDDNDIIPSKYQPADPWFCLHLRAVPSPGFPHPTSPRRLHVFDRFACGDILVVAIVDFAAKLPWRSEFQVCTVVVL